MSDYFTIEHFKLLNDWKGKVYDKTDPKQKHAYDELCKAYDVTKNWAEAVQQRLFENGWTKTVRKPTDQWQKKFIHYNWGRIYPAEDAPEGLAYTVGIDAEYGFVVKIDLVNIKVEDPNLRSKYEQLRGPFTAGPIVAMLSTNEGLSKSFAELVDWSVGAIQQFSMSYDQVAAKLGLIASNSSVVNSAGDAKPLSQSRPRNVIYYGPPGTGKTYELQQILARDYTQRPETVAAEDWKAQQIAEQISGLTWWETLVAALYELGGEAKVPALMDHPYVKAVIKAKQRNKNVARTLWGALQLHALEESKLVKLKRRLSPSVFDKKSDSVWVLAGDWKDECADIIALVESIRQGPQADRAAIRRYDFVTFHQSYGYEEFVEGLRPVLDDESEQLHYEIKQGVFIRLCERARQDSAHQYAIVIDEINRGNVSKILGELITLIEIDKREGAPYAAAATLAYSGHSFSVPANVDIIGAMNTADRSLALVDTALRRRFEFVAKMPDTTDAGPLSGMIVKSGDTSIDVRAMLAMMNRRIETLYDRDHTIGHAYFTILRETSEEAQFVVLAGIFRNRVLPLLEEYFFEDWQKIRLVLGDNQKSEQLQFIQNVEQEVDLTKLFGNQHELDQYSTRRRYQLNDASFSQPGAYVGIYLAEDANNPG